MVYGATDGADVTSGGLVERGATECAPPQPAPAARETVSSAIGRMRNGVTSKNGHQNLHALYYRVVEREDGRPRYNERMSNESKRRSSPGTDRLRAGALLPTLDEVQKALGPAVHVESPSGQTIGGLGDVIRSAAVDSGFRRFSGQMTQGDQTAPIAVSALALVFASRDIASRMYSHVAEAAHLRIQLSGCDVAVETVSSKRDVVSYWGFLHRDQVIVVLTLDTLDVQPVSIADLRSLVLATADKLERVVG